MVRDWRLAVKKTVVWDFRTADVLSGGEGAPLVPVFHFACAKTVGLDKVTAILNIGGVANVTWLDPGFARSDDPGAMLAFDIGPGNALINDFIHSRTGESMDADGAIAAKGTINEKVLARALEHPFFCASAPKSLDRNAFHGFFRGSTRTFAGRWLRYTDRDYSQKHCFICQAYARATRALVGCRGGDEKIER